MGINMTLGEMLEYISEYVNINVYSFLGGCVLAAYNGRNAIYESYNDCMIEDMLISNGLVEFWINELE